MKKVVFKELQKIYISESVGEGKGVCVIRKYITDDSCVQDKLCVICKFIQDKLCGQERPCSQNNF